MISDKYIAKIEGHGSLEADWQKNKVELRVHEGERLFEGMLLGRHVEEAHWITPRICGVCPIAHNLASLRACESGYGIKINSTADLLRNLMNCGQVIQSHVLHLFFLSLPDYLGIDRGTELAKKNPKAFQAALDLKEVSDEIAYVVAGRNVHPTTTAIGGFHKIPVKKELEALLRKIKKTRGAAEAALKICAGIKYPELKGDLEFVAQIKEQIFASGDKKSAIEDYKKVITEQIKGHSTAKFGSYKKRPVMVGSLARLFFSKNEHRKLLDFQNPFHNNLAQGIEILFFHKEAEKILDSLLKTKMSSAIAEPKNKKTSFEGIGAIEAPRGGLYHEYHFDKDGILTYANIITPTVQNLTSVERSANLLVEQYKERPVKEKEHLLEMLVRAYDPCITCSVH